MACSTGARHSRRSLVRGLLKFGRRFRIELGRVAWSRPQPGGRSDVIVVVSTAVSKKSTERNRIRRQISEALRALQRPSPLSISAVISIDPAVRALPSRGRRALAKELFERLTRLSHPS